MAFLPIVHASRHGYVGRMDVNAPALPEFTVRAAGRAARELAGAVFPVVAFGIGFGAAAIAAGLSPGLALAMSGFVFAGASQYAALELWHAPLPLFGLIVTTLAVNARHIVLGATLHRYLSIHRPLPRYAAVALLSDANWAVTHDAARKGERDLAHLVGGGLLLWGAWLLGTWLGVTLGQRLPDLDRFGIDAVMPAFFISTLIGMSDRDASIAPWIIAALAAGASLFLVPAHWAILIGTCAGGGVGAWWDARD